MVAALLTACTTGQQRLSEPAPATSEGSTTILLAAQEAASGRFGVADRMLSDFSARAPGSPEAAETLYWRALFRVDPANLNASAREAVALLDSYLSGATGTHRLEAQTLRRVAAAMDARAAASTIAVTPPKTDPPKPEDKVRDEEIQRLKDELAKANAELERIKRRLAQPKP
jgi:hypothetical protein